MVNLVGSERERPDLINFEETELRLGLPGGSENNGDMKKNNTNSNGKRGFEVSVDLKLKLSSKEMGTYPNDLKMNNLVKEKSGLLSSNDIAKPPSKAQVVGWPPVRSFRKNIMAVQKISTFTEEGAKVNGNATFVKVSLDGAPYLRKVDLNMYKSYQDLSDSLVKMFSSFTIAIGNCGSQGKKDFLNESKLRDILKGSDYVPTYEDRDGDWMLVGDVPWEMFVGSCKRLRIMKGAEAIGLAPKAMEKCKNRS